MTPDKSRSPGFSGESSSADLVIVLTTWPADHDSDAIAHSLVEQRLAACITVLPVHRAVYRWEDTVESADERQLVIKTTHERLAALQAAVRAAHPYDVPEWLELPVTASDAYGAWLRASCDTA